MPATAVFAPGVNALITGAASGVGLAIARLCQSKGMNILLVDRNAEALEAAKKELSGEESTIAASVTDVSNPADWAKLKNTIETNLFGVINGIGTFLPLVKQASESKPTSIVITGSKQGITNPPGNPAYNASKAAVKSLAEQLSWDLKDTKTSTGAGHIKEKPAGAWAPEQVADYLYKKMEQDKFYIICPDNEVSEDTDKKRMLWSVGDIVNERPPLSRWREGWRQEAAETMEKTQI
ncbi:hypothetical protein ACO1O0_004802 [Amphichorda felina]